MSTNNLNKQELYESNMSEKYELKVFYLNDYCVFSLNNNTTISKILKLIEVYYHEEIERFKNSYCVLSYLNKNLNSIDKNEKLIELIKKEIDFYIKNPDNNINNSMEDCDFNNFYSLFLNIENELEEHNEFSNRFEFTCIKENNKRLLILNIDDSLNNLKYSILSNFNDLNLENYSIIYQGIDLSKLYSDNKSLKDIFKNDLTIQLNNYKKSININLTIENKNDIMVKFYKKCSNCNTQKAVKLCIYCCSSKCKICLKDDKHYGYKLHQHNNNNSIESTKILEFILSKINNNINNSNEDSDTFIDIEKFKEFETKSLTIVLSFINNQMTNDFKNISDNKYCIDNIKSIEDLDNESNINLNLLKSISIYQYNQLKTISDSASSLIKPDDFKNIIFNVYNKICDYLKEPYYDCEESMKSINSFIQELEQLKTQFYLFKNTNSNFNNKLIKCKRINKEINNYLKSMLTKIRQVLDVNVNSDNNVKEFKILLKVFDNERILAYNHNLGMLNTSLENNEIILSNNNNIDNYSLKSTNSLTNDNNNQLKLLKLPRESGFKLLQFCDKEYMFKNNFNNYVQINFNDKLFILTGSSSQKFFIYDYKSNEMEYVNSLNFSHNWWPSLVLINISNKIKLYCFSGSYTNKCEELILENNIENSSNNIKTTSLVWKEIKQIKSARGQASSVVINSNICYLFFGYDYKHNSISTIERYNGLDWEEINFKNNDKILSLLYYHSNLLIQSDQILIFGGKLDLDNNDCVYSYNFLTNKLNKTEICNSLSNSKFQSEKCFVPIDLDLKNKINININNNNHNYKHNHNLNVDKNILYDSLEGTSFNKIKYENKNNSNNITQYINYNYCTFAIFDSYNNVHIFNKHNNSYIIKLFNDNNSCL